MTTYKVITHEAFAPLDHADLTEKTYRLLREKILRRQLKAGEKISVDEAAEGLGISRTPVLHALERLANDGLVKIIPRKGTFVSELTKQDVKELFDIRVLIETYAASIVLQNKDIENFLLDLEKPFLRAQRAIVDEDYGDYETYIQADRDFHVTLVGYPGNHHLIRIYDSLNVHMQVARMHYLASVESARVAQREHEAIIDAFRTGQLKEVEDALRTHICNVKNRLIEILDASGGNL